MPPKKKPVTVASYYTKPGQKKKVKKKVVQNYNRKTGTQQRVRDTKNAGSLLASYMFVDVRQRCHSVWNPIGAHGAYLCARRLLAARSRRCPRRNAGSV